MPEFTIEIQTHAGTTSSDDVLERFGAFLVEDELVLGPAVSLNTRTGAVSALFQVEADTFEQAVDVSVKRVLSALVRVALELPDKVGGAPGGTMQITEDDPPIDKVLIERVTDREFATA